MNEQIRRLRDGRLYIRRVRQIFWLSLALLVAGCADQPLLVVSATPGAPAAEQSAAASASLMTAPRPPGRGPESPGGAGLFRPVDGLTDAAACLQSGQPVYAVMQANANVRLAPEVESCRLGRAPAGTVVRVEGLYAQGEENPLLSLNRQDASQGYGVVGYAEDIQPIFAQSCAICHGDLVQNAELNVTTYESLLAGSKNGPVVVPGRPQDSFLWHQVSAGVMPLVGELSVHDKRLIYDWIRSGAPENRPALPGDEDIWLRINPVDYNPAAGDCVDEPESAPSFINSTLVRFATCVAGPQAATLADYLPRSQDEGRGDVDKILSGLISRPFGLTALQAVESIAPAKPAAAPAENDSAAPPAAAPPAAASRPAPARTGISAAPLGLGAPTDDDPWLVPQGGFCVEQRLQQKLDGKGITSLAFAPDGRLFLGLDSPSTGAQDPNILFDAFHPSRSIAVSRGNDSDTLDEILRESGRITGMVWRDGALWLNRAGEVGRIVDGGQYERLAAGFAVEGRLFHANNGIAIVNGWLYVSAGGVRDGYSDGLIAVGDGDQPAESLATSIAGGNPFGSRIVRARLDRLVTERNIGVFQTAARGVRNPYGLTADPSGRLWFTDNGATNVPGGYSAGDEVNLLDPNSLSGAAAAGDESATPYYGFPLALAGIQKDWWSGPVLPLLNTSAPTAITWAYGTVFYAQYGRDPGLYRIANQGGRLVSERVLLVWPIQAVNTAPDGAVWIGTGDGGLYRLTPGCG